MPYSPSYSALQISFNSSAVLLIMPKDLAIVYCLA